MALIDDLKQKTEAGLKTLKETAQDLAFTVEKHAVIGKKRYLDKARLERSIQTLSCEIGEYVTDLYTSEKTIDRDDPYIGERVSEIGRLRVSITQLEEEIETIKKTQNGKYDVQP